MVICQKGEVKPRLSGAKLCYHGQKVIRAKFLQQDREGLSIKFKFAGLWDLIMHHWTYVELQYLTSYLANDTDGNFTELPAWAHSERQGEKMLTEFLQLLELKYFLLSLLLSWAEVQGSAFQHKPAHPPVVQVVTFFVVESANQFTLFPH